MKRVIQDFTKATYDVFQYFRCPADYLLKSLVHMQWRVWEEDGIFFLTYWNEKITPSSLVMARKNGELLLYRTAEYTLAVAIDCVKIGFILYNGNEEG